MKKLDLKFINLPIPILVLLFAVLLFVIIWACLANRNFVAVPPNPLHSNPPLLAIKSKSFPDVEHSTKCYLKLDGDDGQSIPLGGIKQGESPDYSKNIVCYAKIGKNLPQYIFDISTYNANPRGMPHYEIEKIKISTESKIIQDLDIDFEQTGVINFYAAFPIYDSFAIDDINFDGYGDIRIKIDQGASGGNTVYAFYLFNPKTGRFEYNKGFSSVIGTYKKIDNAVIATHNTSDSAGKIFTDSAYVVENNNLILIKEIKQTKNLYDSTYTRITKELMNGQLVVTKNKVLREDELGQ